MVLVNNPGTWGAIYGPLRHADWHGWTPTDLIFPFFLFIVGVAIPLALGRRLEADPRPGRLVPRILRRSAIIFALGLVLHAVSNPDFATIRIPGVLQRIAVCYLVAALLFAFTEWRAQAVVAAATLVGYWALLTLVPVPGFGAGDLGKEVTLRPGSTGRCWVRTSGVLAASTIPRESSAHCPLSPPPSSASSRAGLCWRRPRRRRPSRASRGAAVPAS